MLPKRSIILYLMYINFYINAAPTLQGNLGAKCPGAKHPVGAKRPGAKRSGGETFRGGNGFWAKRTGTIQMI